MLRSLKVSTIALNATPISQHKHEFLCSLDVKGSIDRSRGQRPGSLVYWIVRWHSFHWTSLAVVAVVRLMNSWFLLRTIQMCHGYSHCSFFAGTMRIHGKHSKWTANFHSTNFSELSWGAFYHLRLVYSADPPKAALPKTLTLGNRHRPLYTM